MGKIIQQLGSLDRNFSKKDIVALAEEHAQQIIEKDYDLLKVYVELKRYETYLETIIKTMKEQTVAKALELEEKTFVYANAKLVLTNRTKYDYQADPTWALLNEELNQLKTLKKEHEAQLKKLTEDVELINEETGEIEVLIAPSKEVTEQMSVRL